MKIRVTGAFLFNVLCTISYTCCGETVGKRPPHIVMIIADDMGSNDLSYRGLDQITTANLDAMGFNGIIFNRHYTEPICTPSRAALLTGQYPIRLGLQGEPISAGEDRHLPPDVQTLPQLLKELGYTTHLVGKWHLGTARREDIPKGRGFDTHYGYWNGYIGYFDYETKSAMTITSEVYEGFDMKENFVDAWKDKGIYATHIFTEKALDIIDAQNKDIPMFLMVGHLAVHTGKNGMVEVADEKTMNNTYGYIADLERRRYVDALMNLDDSVGRIVEKLQQRDLLQNSVVIFMSDNGAQIRGIFHNGGSNYPLRGEKFSHHDGGIKNAALLYSPLLEKKNYIHDHLIHITDWLPTLYSLAGGNITSLKKTDGVDQWLSISQNKPSKRKNILINIDEVKLYSGVIGYGGRYKLLNGTIQSGFYDSFTGEPQSSNKMDYDIAAILNSRVNKAIKKSKVPGKHLDEALIRNLRKSSSAIRNNSKCNRGTEKYEICHHFCLFDLWTDPCETENLIRQKSKDDIVLNLKNQLAEFWNEVSPQTNKPVDINSDPAKYNGTWCTWLDDEFCIKIKTNNQNKNCNENNRSTSSIPVLKL
ncbi:hypothetical protein WA026_019598 [Henosepilachna vigintioctopunctata]|uniref:Sulfatase N-terminal domain-containing protein n=1 Tax=Henosepilachna vigintioctopunctata TaxID=420089 RepID=A0AAW1TWP9_9CUCU